MKSKGRMAVRMVVDVNHARDIRRVEPQPVTTVEVSSLPVRYRSD